MLAEGQNKKNMEGSTMKVYKEVYDSSDFDFWAGARDTVKYLEDEEVEQIFSELDMLYPEGMEETEVNDFFWFDDDVIAEWLGWPDFETLMKARSSGNWYSDFDEWCEESNDFDE